VKASSVVLHDLLARMGCPIGAKAGSLARGSRRRGLSTCRRTCAGCCCPRSPSAEATTPALQSGRGHLAPLAIKQAGVDRAAIDWLGRLVASLGFEHAITESGGPRPAGGRTWVLQVQGGESEQLRWLREIGFCRASRSGGRPPRSERRGTAGGNSSTCGAPRSRQLPRPVPRARGPCATWSARPRHASTFRRHSSITGSTVAGTRAARRTGGPIPTTATESRGWRCSTVAEGPVVPVYDVVTGDEAEGFLAAGRRRAQLRQQGRSHGPAGRRRPARHAALMDAIVEGVSFGVGRRNAEPVEHPVLDRIREAPFVPQRGLRSLAAQQLGTGRRRQPLRGPLRG
jgi:hypothetical protein